jgi:hypothetical protein
VLSLCATFENWFIVDGNYPLLKKGQKVNISFFMQSINFKINDEELYQFDQIKYSDYNFCGKVIYTFHDLIVIETMSIKLYIKNHDKNNKISVGQFVKGSGKLMIDPFHWVMDLDKFVNPPNLFYNMQITKLYLVGIPVNFIKGKILRWRWPCSLSSDNINDNYIKEIKKMCKKKYI